MKSLALLALLSLASCGSLHSKLDSRIAAPREVAILPFAGDGSLQDRELMRTMLKERLAVRYIAVLDTAWVDRVLSEHGWLGDPEAFDPKKLPLPAVCEALGTPAVIVGTDFGSSSFDIGLFYRRGVGGKLEWLTAKGNPYFEAEYFATTTGGVILKSGQIFQAILDTFESGTSRGFVALVEEYYDTVLGALPDYPVEGRPDRPRAMLESARIAAMDGDLFHVVAKGSPGLVVTFDVTPELARVPTFEVRPGEYETSVRIAQGKLSGNIIAHARDSLGREVSLPAAPTGSASATGVK